MDTSKSGGTCVPEFPPGFNFWDEDESATEICGQASAKCVVVVEYTLLQKYGTDGLSKLSGSEKDSIEDFKDAIDDKDYGEAEDICDDLGGENCDCLSEEWARNANRVCTALGDCGGDINYVGDYNDDGYVWTVDGDRRSLE